MDLFATTTRSVCARLNPDCKAEAQRRRYAASNASRRANARRWQQEHREQHLANKARYRKNNPESVKESARKIREKSGVTPKRRDPGPLTSSTWIYALCNDRDQVLYIGQTVQELSLRLWHHRAGGGCLAGGDRLYQANRPSAFQGRRPGGAGHDQGLP